MAIIRSNRRNAVAAVIVGVWGAALWHLSSLHSSPVAFSSPPQAEAQASRRSALGAALAVAVTPTASLAAEFLGIGKLRGAFEVDPKDAVIVGDAENPKMKAAKAKVLSLQKEAEEALAAVNADTQADISGMMRKLGIGELRGATNAINDIMDDSSAAGTQRLQRLMIQAKFALEDDIPFPTTRKGKVMPRGDSRRDRMVKDLQDYIMYSKQLMQFLA